MTKEKPFKKIIDAITGEETIIELTVEEIADLEKMGALFEAQKAEEDAAEKAKATAKAALLERLGMTADEAALLLA